MKSNSLKIGIPSMFMLLFSLCLIVFCILSFTSAVSDYKLTSKLLERTSSYYEQCNNAMDTIPTIDCSQDITFPIDDSQGLFVSYQSNGDNVKIISWKVVNLNEDNYNEHLNVLP